MLNALTVAWEGAHPEGVERASRAMRRQGFAQAVRHGWQGGNVQAWAHPAAAAVSDCQVRTADGEACCVGPVWYRGRFGTAALALLLGEMQSAGRFDEEEMRGNFALYLHAAEHCLLVNDVLGLVRIHVSSDARFCSTSWLATCAYLGGVVPENRAAVEYVLLGASHSGRTPVRGVTTLPAAHLLDLARNRVRARLERRWPEPVRPAASWAQALDAAHAELHRTGTEIALAFPAKVRAALSGGFDSRLITAIQLACGNAPALFVYGDSCSADVLVAAKVAKAAGLCLETIDKQAMPRPGPARPGVEQLVRNGWFFDGIPNDGILDSGVDRQTRLAQTQGGYIALNGGGGEIFRNFFHLPDRSYRGADVVKAFYRGFDARVFRHAGALARYSQGLVASMLETLGLDPGDPEQKLTRAQVELLYPLFRCHYWMGVNNSVSVRHGFYATPLLDHASVRLAASLPLAWKQAGRFQARLVECFHPVLARQPSTHGFRFSDGPDWRARLSEWSTCRRPVWVRPAIHATRRRLHGTGVSPSVMAHGRSLLPGEWRLDPVLDLARLPDDAAFSRAVALEVVWRGLLT